MTTAPVQGPEKPRHIDARITTLSDDDLIAAFGRPDGVADVAELRAWVGARLRPVAWPLSEWADRARGGDEASKIIAAADRLLDGGLDVTGADQGRSQRYGWHYLGWLAEGIQAWLLTGDQQRLRAVDRHLVRWAETRDSVTGEWPGLDVIWYSLGTWARCRNLLPALEVLTPAPLSDRAWRELVAALIGGARWAYDEHDRFRHGNWQLVSATQLIQLAAVLPDLTEAPDWDRRGRERLLEHLELDVYPDGGHYERSPGYHVMCLDAVQLAAMIDRRYGDGTILRHPRVRAMHDWLVTLTGSGGWVPHLQDSGIVWPADWLRRGGELLDAPELITAADATPVPGPPAIDLLPDSGYAVLRAEDDLRAVINLGPHIEHELESHSHRAVLDLVLDGWGRPLLWEAGGPASYDVPDYLSWYQAGRGHNTVTVDDAELADDRGARLLGTWTAGPVLALSAEHHGYGPAQRREVIMAGVDPVVIIVRDRTEEQPARRFRCYWHAVEPWRATEAGFRTGTPGGPGLLITVLPAPGETVRFDEGVARRPDPVTGTADPAPLYGLVVERPTGAFTSVLRPGPDPDDLALTATDDGHGRVVVQTANVVDTIDAARWVRRDASGALRWAAAWAGSDLDLPEVSVRQRDPLAGTLASIGLTVDAGRVGLDVISTGRSGLRITGLAAAGGLRLNGIDIDAHRDDETIMIGLPMAGRWRIDGLSR
ncbi:heparinase II/III family protein [Microlunatus sp. GCM10028923]|uniref:heparinase II/III domain-containing protein n=1 Tax=Microlunatus sp. GCM10028923 TaxID=3273400 RepID=UPI0036203EFC